MFTLPRNWPALLGYVVAAIGFVVVSLYLVLYATGYRVDFRDGKLEKTGVLAITTKPTGATVYLDGKKYGKTTPFTLRNMAPGDYKLKLELADYRPYERTVTIISNQATEVHNVDLLLNTLEPRTLTEKFDAPVYLDNDQVIYFSTDKKFMRLTGSEAVLDFEKLPTHVKSLLTGASGLYLAKKADGSSTMALGVVNGGRKSLVLLDPYGYRGTVFGAPANAILAEDLFFIDNDRLVGMANGTVYTIDLNLNQVGIYAKNVLAINHTGGKLYFVTKTADGLPILMADQNVFDTRPAEVAAEDLPVAKEYEILLSNDYGLILNAISTTKGVWWHEKQKDGTYTWLKIASGVEDMMYDFVKDRLYFVTQGSLRAYDLKTQKELAPKLFNKPVDILGKRNESIFLSTDGKLMVIDADLTNLYEIAPMENATVLLGQDSRRIYMIKDHHLEERELRKGNGGFFGNLLPPKSYLVNGQEGR